MTARDLLPARKLLALSRHGLEKMEKERPEPRPGDAANSLPLSAGQKGMWFTEQYSPGTSMFNINLSIHLRGPLNIQCLEQAITDVIGRHEVLRARFLSVDGHPVQIIMPAEPVRLRLASFTNIPEGIRRKEALDAAADEAEKRFDLAAGKLFRFALLRLGESEHFLVFTAHHIVFDGWSAGILFREIAAFYNAAISGAATSPGDLPARYADYTAWQSEWLEQAESEKQSHYWRRRLEGADFGFNMLTDRPRPARKTARGADVTLEIPQETAKLCLQFARMNGLTPFMILYAAFRLALARHADQADVLVAVPVAGRPHTRFESLIGLFAGTIFLRTPVDEDKTFAQLTDSVRDELLDSLTNQNYPLTRIIEDIQPERDLGTATVVHVQFALQNFLDESITMENVESSTVILPFRNSVADIELNIFRRKGSFECILRYDTDLFDADSMRRFLGHFVHLLGKAAQQPATKMAELEMLPPAERLLTVAGWNQTQAQYSENVCLHDLIEAQARRTPRAIAVEFEDRRLTYRELALRSTKLANRLRGLGVGRESVVGVCLERSLDVIVALLGVMKAGAAYLPLDPVFPVPRLAYMLQDSGAATLIAGTGQVGLFAGYAGNILMADEIADLGLNESATLPPSGAAPDDLAYILYTSGSTGMPKGVMIPHRAVVNFLESMRREPGLGPGDSILAITTLSFDIAVLELFLPLASGGTVIMADRDTVTDGRKLVATIAKRKVKLMQATPATWRMMIDSGWTGDRRLKALCGGEALSRELADELLARVGSLWNMYGPTETTVWSAISRVQPGTGPVPAGRPIANTTLYILDERGRPVPAGVAGKLYIGGAGLARGYRNQADLTAKTFVPNPLPECCGERIYSTGDIARYLADGDIEWLGRIDGQIKIRGHRIETGEIESVLRQHESVREAVVLVRQKSDADRHLVAWLLPSDAGAPPSDELRKYAGQRLPAYMVPAVYRFVESFPMTLNGKIDRRALANLKVELEDSPQQRAMPETPLESQLVRIFERIFDFGPIGVTDNFFDLGGHSLLAVRLVDRIENETGYSLALTTLFEAPTIREIARRIEEGVLEPEETPIVKLQSGDPGSEPLFCIHWLDAKLVTFQKIASMLPGRTVYGLHPSGLAGQGESIRSIEEMAALYVKEVRAAYPSGPYHLAGSCLGGVVAFEIARQLKAEGHQVGLVLMIDAMMPGHTPYLHPRDGLPALLDSYIGEFMMSPPAALGRWLRESWTRLVSLTRRETTAARRTGRLRSINMAAAKAYQPEPFEGRLTMLMCSEGSFRAYQDLRLGWSSVARGGFEVHVVPGNHSTMEQEPNIQVLARCVRTSIDRMEKSSPGRALVSSRRLAGRAG